MRIGARQIISLVGQIYLKDNPLLESPRYFEHIKPRLLGHWGTTPGSNFLYVHLNRLIKENDLDMMYVIGPGHGGPGIVAMTISKARTLNAIRQSSGTGTGCIGFFANSPGLTEFRVTFRRKHRAQFTKGENSAIRWSTLMAQLSTTLISIVACIIGDGEAETGALATSWHSNKFLNPARDGAVLPILHLNGFRSRKSDSAGAYQPPGTDGQAPHLVTATSRILSKAMFRQPCINVWLPPARYDLGRDLTGYRRPRVQHLDKVERPLWPMIVFRTPKGWDWT